MIKNLFLIIGICFTLLAETKFAEPKPSMFEQRKILFSISSAEDKAIGALLNTTNNILKFYGVDNVRLRIVAYSDGMKILLKKNKEIAKRIEALIQVNVEFVACRNTMQTKDIKEKDLIQDIEIVTAGVAELVERSVAGWTNIVP